MRISQFILPLIIGVCTISFVACDKIESASCTDGIMNGDETGVDCGGDCSACSTCNDGIQNGNETGVDCGGDCNPCNTNNCSITDYTGTGTAVGVARNNCGDRQITLTNDGSSNITLEMPVPNVGTLTLVGQITSGCSFGIPLDTVSEGGLEVYYSGSGSLSGNTLNFTYRADYSFGGGFDCDYTAQLQ